MNERDRRPISSFAGGSSRRSESALIAIFLLARTIADLASGEMIAAPHLDEALQYSSRSGAEGWRGIYFPTAAGTHTAGRM